jgi:hypothetical protein
MKEEVLQGDEDVLVVQELFFLRLILLFPEFDEHVICLSEVANFQPIGQSFQVTA